ncbi:hypothetical protein HK104_005496 [Borealophlyctis nickersoniae]|nr:hypothetical protein HK104_005496 [Borealophlyctis nickersoniae]
MLFENETPLVKTDIHLAPNPRKVRKDVEILWRLILLAKYITEKGKTGDGEREDGEGAYGEKRDSEKEREDEGKDEKAKGAGNERVANE